jgi:hypothetical protein
LINDQNVVGTIGISIDITDRKKKKELENKTEIIVKTTVWSSTKSVVHDIVSSLMVLGAFQYLYNSNLIYNKLND